jgi:hypothetical protein
MERLDLGQGMGIRHDGDPGLCTVLLPGQFYPSRAPVLWFAREAVSAQGWTAIEVLGEPGLEADPLGWERECAERALEKAGGATILVIGKSLASLLAGWVSDLELPAVWLTPVMTDRRVTDGLARARRQTLLVGGTADALWDRGAIPSNPALEVLEFADVDHALQVAGDPMRSLDVLRDTVGAVGRLAAGLRRAN